jgi:hypothetical protein
MDVTFVQKDGDSASFQQRSNLKSGDSGNFASNNNNPFLVSPYTPVNLGAFATNNTVNDISSIVSSLFGNLTTVIDVDTNTLRISTILPPTVGNDTITLAATRINMNTTESDIFLNNSDILLNSNGSIKFSTALVKMDYDLHVRNSLVVKDLFFSNGHG